MPVFRALYLFRTNVLARLFEVRVSYEHMAKAVQFTHRYTRIFGSIVKCWLACAWTTILVLVQVCKCASLTTVRRIDCQATNHRRHRESDRVLYGIRETHTHRHIHIHIQRPTAVEYQFHGWVCFESDRGIQRTVAHTHTDTNTSARTNDRTCERRIFTCNYNWF